MRKKFALDIVIYVVSTLLIYALMTWLGASAELQNAIWAGLILAATNGVTTQVLHKLDEKKPDGERTEITEK
jgi:hypothetical protein